MILVGIFIMFSVNTAIRFFLTFNKEYLFTLIFSLSQISMIYVYNSSPKYQTVYKIIAITVIVITCNEMLGIKCRSISLSKINYTIDLITVVWGVISLFLIFYKHYTISVFYSVIILLTPIYIIIAIFCISHEKKEISRYDLFYYISSLIMIAGSSFLLFSIILSSNFRYISYLSILFFIVYFEAGVFMEKRLISEKIENANKNNGNNDKIRKLFLKNNYTSREIEIITLLVSQQTSKEIAYHLGLSKSTIDWHIANIYKKSGVNNKKDFLNIIHNPSAVALPQPTADTF